MSPSLANQIRILSPSAHQQIALEALTNASVEFLGQMRTSKSSLRVWRLKCLYTAYFFEANKPFDVKQFCSETEHSLEFIRRSLTRSLTAGRVYQIQNLWFPREGLIETFRSIFNRAGIPFREIGGPFVIKILNQNLTYSKLMSDVLLAINPRHTLTQYCVELALWETHYQRAPYRATLGQLANRLNLNKSTLSTALWQLAELKQVSSTQHPEDDRQRLWVMNTSQDSVKHRQRLLDSYLHSACS